MQKIICTPKGCKENVWENRNKTFYPKIDEVTNTAISVKNIVISIRSTCITVTNIVISVTGTSITVTNIVFSIRSTAITVTTTTISVTATSITVTSIVISVLILPFFQSADLFLVVMLSRLRCYHCHCCHITVALVQLSNSVTPMSH